MTSSKTLFLTIKKEYFDQIKNGQKTSEFREYKKYWIKKLMNNNGSFKPFDYILFQNGYKKNPPQLTIECKTIKIKRERISWLRHEKYFEIELGKIINEKNIIP